MNLEKEKRLALLETAAREFAEKGYNGASLNSILRKAGYSKGAAYYYFENKADLFAGVAEHYSLPLRDMIDELKSCFSGLTAENYWSKFEMVIGTLIERYFKKNRVLSLLKVAWLQSPELKTLSGLSNCFSQGDEVLQFILSRGKEAGAVRTDVPDDLLFHIFVGIDNAFDLWISKHPELDSEELVEVSKKMLMTVKSLFGASHS